VRGVGGLPEDGDVLRMGKDGDEYAREGIRGDLGRLTT
jgi:hypothetical protein